MNGIEESIKQLKKLKGNLKNVEEERHYTMKEVFNDTFMAQHTKFPNISDFLDASGLDFSSQESFQNVNIELLDKFVSENSEFSSWKEMKSAAGKLITQRQITDF